MDCVYFSIFFIGLLYGCNNTVWRYNSITFKNDSRPSLLDSLAHSAVFRAVQAISKYVNDTEPMYCIDATAGNGHDTCFWQVLEWWEPLYLLSKIILF